LNRSFTVDAINGESSLDYSHDRTIHTQDNYTTQSEWEQRNENLQQIIDELQEDDGANLGGGLFGGGGLPSLPGLGVVESAIVVALGFAGLNALSS